MTHDLGPVVSDGRVLDESTGIDFIPAPGVIGDPRFVMLHFDNVALSGSARLHVDLGYGTDIFNPSSGSSFWSRPADPGSGPISIRISGGSGSARLREYGSGQPTETGMPGTPCGSRSNPDVFFHTDPYQEPVYETRLMCNPGFAWQNAACPLPSIPAAVKDSVAAASGMIVMVHDGHVSSCSGTLIAADLFLTARHCLTHPTGADIRSASVTFDYAPACDGSRPGGHVTRFFKVIDEVVSGIPDWVIVRLDGAPGALPAPLEMRDAELMVGEAIFSMHHPGGAVKKTQAGVYDGGAISNLDFAGGSSGSALFDANGRLVRGPLSTGGSCGSAGACSVGYVPVVPIKIALTSPPVPPAPLDVMIVFDRSGSMAGSAPPIGRTKLEEAQDAASLFIQLVRESSGHRVGLVTFSSTAGLDRGIGDAATVKPLLVGPPPFTTGDIGDITALGSTSIGAGIETAHASYGTATPNDRAILLLSDGLQNTPPMIEDVEGLLTSTKLCVIGFGSDDQINGPLLSRIAREHDGEFTRAVDGLALRKFFGLCFGNIFEAGALSDPDFLLPSNQDESKPHEFSVCGEESITLVLGWDDPATPLRAHIRTPSGKVITKRCTETARGRTWVFWRIPLPCAGEREGTWHFTVDRVPADGEFPPPPTDVRYFSLVVCDGGPSLVHLGGPRRVYTGDAIDPRVSLHYPNGTTPRAEVKLIIETPTVALGHLVAKSGLNPPTISADAVGSFHATLQKIAAQSGGTLPVPSSTVSVPLFDDGDHDDGAMEPDGIYNNRLEDLTRAEGTYEFHAMATFGNGCRATREAFWSIHVEVGIDPDHSDVSLTNVTDDPFGHRGTLVLVPRDRYKNPLGPGRAGAFGVAPIPGARVDGPVKDRGDGSYGVDIAWDPAKTPTPGVLVHQPDRDPVLVATPERQPDPRVEHECTQEAGALLECLGLRDTEVKRVRVKRVCLDVDLSDPPCAQEPDC